MAATGLSVAILAQAGDALNLLLTGILLVAAFLAGAAVIAWVARWRRNEQDIPGTSPSDQLAHFRSLYEQGAINLEEFNRLKSMLGGQLRAELNVKPKAAEPGRPAPRGDLPPIPPKEPPPVNGTGGP